MIKKINRLKN